jgi:phosphotransferase system HPr (HPr) family protein
MKGDRMAERIITVASKSGLHARPAAVFVQKAKSFQSQIALIKDTKTVNGKSILSVISLGATQGEQVTLQANGEDAETALEQLAVLLEKDLG